MRSRLSLQTGEELAAARKRWVEKADAVIIEFSKAGAAVRAYSIRRAADMAGEVKRRVKIEFRNRAIKTMQQWA